jgi:hypothetical protein
MDEVNKDIEEWSNCSFEKIFFSGISPDEASKMCQPASRMPEPLWFIQVTFVGAFLRT